MFATIVKISAIFLIVSAQKDSTNSTKSQNLSVIDYVDYDDDSSEQLDRVEEDMENIRQKMNSLDMKFAQQLNIIKALFKKNETIDLDFDSQLTSTSTEQTARKLQLREFKTRTKTLPPTCKEALEKTGLNGVYKVNISHYKLPPFNAYCLRAQNVDEDIDGAWLLIQRRKDGSVNFERPWRDYQNGFGNLEDEFFIGLDKLYLITQTTVQELWIQMEDYESNKRWAKYGHFAIGAKNDGYRLYTLGDFHGNAGDSLTKHLGRQFSTWDRDNDELGTVNCAKKYKGAWWYAYCFYSNLNGMYSTLNEEGTIHWSEFRGYKYSLKYVHMAIRPRQ